MNNTMKFILYFPVIIVGFLILPDILEMIRSKSYIGVESVLKDKFISLAPIILLFVVGMGMFSFVIRMLGSPESYSPSSFPSESASDVQLVEYEEWEDGEEWECEYCKGMNPEDVFKCGNCGAPRKRRKQS